MLRLLVPLAMNDSPAALTALDDLFIKGAGATAPDADRATRYYERAAVGSDFGGTYKLALMLLESESNKVDVSRAIDLLEDLAEGGDPWILIQLADVYLGGKAEPAERAVPYLEQAAARDNSAAMVRLAQVYRSGTGAIAPDAAKARRYLEAAARLDDVAAQVTLAQVLLAAA